MELPTQNRLIRDQNTFINPELSGRIWQSDTTHVKMVVMKVTILTPEKFLDKAKAMADKLKPAYQAVVKLDHESPSRSDVVLRLTREGRILPLADRTGRLDLYLQVESAVALKRLGIGA